MLYASILPLSYTLSATDFLCLLKCVLLQHTQVCIPAHVHISVSASNKAFLGHQRTIKKCLLSHVEY